MKLASYLEHSGLTPSQFARQMGRPASTITRLMKGQRNPSIALLQQIADATKGEVMPNDFFRCEAGGFPQELPASARQGSGPPKGLIPPL